jgi:hypothetical protein
LLAALSALLGLPSPALAVDAHFWFWTTAQDANPLPYSECQSRAMPALSAAGLSTGQMGANPDTFYGLTNTDYAMLMCIAQPRGFYMVLDIAVNGGSRSAIDIGNAINSAFWGMPSPSFSGSWQLSSNCGWGPSGSWLATISLNEAADGTLSGTVLSDNNTTNSGGVSVLADSTGYANVNPLARSSVSGNMMSLILHPNTWVSALLLTGHSNSNGNLISGGIRHYGSDDCTFTMTRLQ